MIILSFLLFLTQSLFSDDTTICKSCHPSIYSEFTKSFHNKSTIKHDIVHKAVWQRHPLKKHNDYKCAKCHSPKGKDRGVDCITCHTIKTIQKDKKSNKNIYTSKKKYFYSAKKGSENEKLIYHESTSWFGLFKKSVGSPYHDIDYTNKNYYTAKVCMGCHSHKENSLGFQLCKTGDKGVNSKENCISCHMPQVKGSVTTIKQTKTHAFHGFAGVRNSANLLKKYIDIDIRYKDKNLTVYITNKAPHELLTQPLRTVELRVKSNDKLLKKVTFQKVLGTNSKPSPPWLATKFLQDTMIKANSTKQVSFKTDLLSDEVEIVLGYYIVNPKSIKKLGLENDKDINSFYILKRKFFKLK